MYAGDTTIYFNLEDFDPRRIENETNNELERGNIWLKLNKLSLNIKRTKLMIFGSNQKKIKEINFSIDNVQIERVHTFNFLGIMLDERLTWTDHTHMVVNKISRITGVLYRLKSVFPKIILLTLCHTLIGLCINYGLLVWGVKSYRIEVPQKKARRLATNNTYFAHSTPLFKSEGLLKVYDIF